MDLYAWLILRVVYAWMFLFPLPKLISNWESTKGLTRLLIPHLATTFFTIVMLMVMFFGAISILFGVYGQLAGLALCVYCLLGAIVHYRLGKTAQHIHVSNSASKQDKAKLQHAIQLATVGNIGCALRNIVLASVACFFMLMGTGPYSLVSTDLSKLVKTQLSH